MDTKQGTFHPRTKHARTEVRTTRSSQPRPAIMPGTKKERQHDEAMGKDEVAVGLLQDFVVLLLFFDTGCYYFVHSSIGSEMQPQVCSTPPVPLEVGVVSHRKLK